MTSASIQNLGLNQWDRPLPENAVLVIGAGYFGRRAAGLLKVKSPSPMILVDKEQRQLDKAIKDSNAIRILADGVQFLSERHAFLKPSNIIVPAVPFHLALAWLKCHIHEKYKPRSVRVLPIQKTLPKKLPYTWHGDDGSLLVSYANFKCPDDCPEPVEACTVTGERRPKPLHALLAEIELPGFRNHVIVSRQLAPGLGGYAFVELQRLLDKVLQTPKAGWLIGTACKCHGVITSVEVI